MRPAPCRVPILRVFLATKPGDRRGDVLRGWRAAPIRVIVSNQDEGVTAPSLLEIGDDFDAEQSEGDSCRDLPCLC